MKRVLLPHLRTDGPWALIRDRVGLTVVTCREDGSIPLNSRIVADLQNVSDEDAQAMIASPDLLLALRLARPYCPVAVQDTIDAAIRKAEGQS